MNDRYKLIGRLPVPVADLIEWGRWFETADRRVARTDVGPFCVSTVFLGLDHRMGKGEPLLFETMICSEDAQILHYPKDFLMEHSWLDYQDRCSTWDEAERMHQRGVAYAQARFAKAKTLLDAWDAG